MQGELWTPTAELPRSPGHPFYSRLNALLAEAKFDDFVEKLCAEHYANDGRPGVPPGIYFRMLLVGYFEGLDSQRGIAWRCADSQSVREFLGLAPTQPAPDHSTLTLIRKRLPDSVFQEMFLFVLKLSVARNLVPGKTIGVDTTTLEANAAMKSIVRKDNGESWNEYLTRLAREAGIENPTPGDLARFDRQRTDKTVSNSDWRSSTDPDARIAKMKDGTTHMAYKAEHAVDLNSSLIVAADVHLGTASDAKTLPNAVLTASVNLDLAGAPKAVEEVAADRGYHSVEALAACAEMGVRTYIPERRQKTRRWDKKPAEQRRAFHANRRRMKGNHGRELSRKRSALVERSFAHICETGGGRRSHLRGLEDVRKRHLGSVIAYNLGVIMRMLHGIGGPRSLQGVRREVFSVVFCVLSNRKSVFFPFVRSSCCGDLAITPARDSSPRPGPTIRRTAKTVRPSSTD
ncbi:MAG: transposase [Planctomycetaceae bacterium]|nr:transposase [Planctomycetaceae bacterium]